MQNGDELVGGVEPTTPPTDSDGPTRFPSAVASANTERWRRAGKFAGQGYPRAWIAERFGADISTVAGWERQPAYLEGYASEEDRLARSATMVLTKIGLSLERLVDTSLEVALDTSHKDSSQERRYLIDKVLTPMSIQHTVNTHTADARFWEPVAAGLAKMAALPPAKVPLLIDGSVAAEEYGASPNSGNGSYVDLAEREMGRTGSPSRPSSPYGEAAPVVLASREIGAPPQTPSPSQCSGDSPTAPPGESP